MSIQRGWVQGKFPLVPRQAVGGPGSRGNNFPRQIILPEYIDGRGRGGKEGEGRGSTGVISHERKSSRDGIDGEKRAKEPPGNRAAA